MKPKTILFFLSAILFGFWACSGPTPDPPPETTEIQGPDDYPVHMVDWVKSNLSFVYSNTRTEIPYCAFGRMTKDSVVVEKVIMPEISSTSDSSATFSGKTCEGKKGFLGYIHNHDPYEGSCQPSTVDASRFLLDKDSKIEIIACPFGFDTVFNAYVKGKE